MASLIQIPRGEQLLPPSPVCPTFARGALSSLSESHRRGFSRLLLVCLALLCLLFPADAPAFTAADADAIFAAYAKAFCYTNAHGAAFHDTTDGGKSHFWEWAEQMEMVLDTYQRSTNPACAILFSNLFAGFVADHGRTWEKNDFNDDILWMVIACARANQLTGNREFAAVAKTNFDLCYARAWSTNMGGGLWWKTDNRSKNACVNGPGAIAACLLCQIYGDTNYLSKARAIYAWERNHLFDTNSGHISDNINVNGHVGRFSFTYNQGTFVGAANFLGYTNDARLAADFTRNTLCPAGFLPAYGQNSDPAGFNGIGVRWIARFMKDRGLQAIYEPWLQRNAVAAWECRRRSDDLAWSRWPEPTPDTALFAWACSSAVVLLQVVPPNQH